MEIVSVADLKIGMFVAEPDCPWTEFSFAFQGFVISSLEQVDIFQQKCRFVYVDRSRSLNEHYTAPKHEKDARLKSSVFQNDRTEGMSSGLGLIEIADQDKRQSRRRRFLDFLHSQTDNEHAIAMSRELAHIEPRYDELSRALEHSYSAFAEGRDVDVVAVREGLRDIAGSLQRNADAVMWLLRLKKRDQYSFDHAMDVSIHLLLLGGHIGWQGNKLLQLGMAGMLQDVGKVNLTPELLTKSVPLSEDEKAQVRSHVASSLEILCAQREIPQEVIVIISRHHERWDGSGYPRGLMLDQIGIEAEMAGLVDSFCAMLRNKPYRSALGHQEALEELYALRDHKFNPNLMEQFVQCVGLYPIGTLVELNGGEVGVVIQQNRVHRSRPRVLLMLDERKRKVSGYQVIDLREDAHKAVRIVRALPYDAYGIAENDYYLG